MSLLLPLLLLLPLGCGKRGGPAMVPVSGRISLDKRPLAGALVRFQPATREGGGNLCPDSYGETDEQGNYTLKPVGDRSNEDGAVAGTHHIQISIFDRESGSPLEKVPAKYNRESKLTFTVPPEGTKAADFDLTSR